MKALFLSMILIAAIFCTQDNFVEKQATVDKVLGKVHNRYDPNDQWDKLNLRVHIREPRPQTPARFSELIIDNQTGYFRLSRQYEEGTIDRVIDASGSSEILLNGSSNIPDDIVEKYRLSRESNFGYQTFYRTIQGLPSTLNQDVVESFGSMRPELFDGMDVHVIPIKLRESLITREWELLVSEKAGRMVALRFIHPPEDEAENEIILFEGEFVSGGVTIPRFRHWYMEEGRKYLGSDILLTELPGEDTSNL
jgi:hypothetical protein